MGLIILWILRFLCIVVPWGLICGLFSLHGTALLIVSALSLFLFLFYFKLFRIPVLGPILKVYLGITGAFYVAILSGCIFVMKQSNEVQILWTIIGTVILSIPISIFVFKVADDYDMVTITTDGKREKTYEKNVNNILDTCKQKLSAIENILNQLSDRANYFTIVDSQVYNDILHDVVKYKKELFEVSSGLDYLCLHDNIDNALKRTNELIAQTGYAEDKFREHQSRQNTYEQTYEKADQSYSSSSASSSGASDFFSGCNTKEETEKVYRNLAKIYHPDNSTGVNEMFQKINEEYQEKLKSFE